jgi:hypothetical protein
LTQVKNHTTTSLSWSEGKSFETLLNSERGQISVFEKWGTLGIKYGEEEIYFWSQNEEQLFLSISEHPRNPIKTDEEQRKFMSAYRFAKNLPFPKRSSGEAYIIHLLHVVSLYLDLATNPTIEGMIDSLHHDTHEDFPTESWSIVRRIGTSRFLSSVLLGKSPVVPSKIPKSLKGNKHLASIDHSRERVFKALEKHAGVLNTLEIEAWIMRVARNAFVLVPFSWDVFRALDAGIAQTEWAYIGWDQIPANILHALGVLYQEILLSWDREDLGTELIHAVSIFEHATEDQIYVKAWADRISNLLDAKYIHDMEAVCFDTKVSPEDLEKLKKLLRSRSKMLATTKMYMEIVRTRMQDPKLYALLEALVKWYSAKLTKLNLRLSQRYLK